MKSFVAISCLPISDTQQVYTFEFDITTTQYSLPDSKNTGDGKVNLVELEPSEVVVTSAGFNVFSANGNIFWVGEPFCICLIWTVIGKLSSLAPT